VTTTTAPHRPRPRVLVVEDNPVNMELAADLLEAAGYDVSSAGTAEEGLRIAFDGTPPDLVLMDIALPGMDGLSATGVLRGDARTARIPVVALTAHAMKGDEDRALAAGCVGYITKPINTRSFARLVNEFLQMRPPATLPAVPAADAPSELSRVELPAPPVAPAVAPTPPPAPALPRLDDAPPLGGAPEPAAPAPGDDDLLPLPLLNPLPPVAPVAAPVVPLTPAEPPVREDLPAAPVLPAWDAPFDERPTPTGRPEPALPPAAPTPAPEPPQIVFAAPPVVSPAEAPPPVMAPTPEPEAPSDFALPPAPTPTPVEPLSISRPESYLPRLSKSGRKRGAVPSAEEGRRLAEMPRVLVADDDPFNREVLADMLQALGCEAVLAEDGFDTLDKADESLDLILLDVMMPGMDGCQTLTALREELHLTDVPVIMVTALSSREDRLRAVEAGANDFITKPVDRTELRVRMASLLKMKAAQDALRKHQRDLEETVRQRTVELRKALQQLTKAQSVEHQSHLDTMHRLALAAEFRDGTTAAAHIRCVGNYCAAIGRGLGLPAATADVLLYAGPVHDIGMLGVPEEVAFKRAEDRTDEEEALYRQHTVLGARLLSGSQAELLRAGETIALTHHERWDGSGFPQGLSGEQIPLFGRICAVADAFDNLTAYRPGVEAYTNDEAKEILASGRGREFDPRVVDAFFARWEEIEQFQRQFRRTEAPPADLRPSGAFALIGKG
jgi:putative two-component system response regulator